MNGAVEILRREREAANEQIKNLRVRLRDLDAAISCLEGQSVSVRSGKTEGDLKPKVLAVLVGRSENGASPREIATSLTAGGRPTSDASVSSTLSRLKGEGKVRNQHGTWFAVISPESANEPMTREFQESETRDEVADQEPDWDDDPGVPF